MRKAIMLCPCTRCRGRCPPARGGARRLPWLLAGALLALWLGPGSASVLRAEDAPRLVPIHVKQVAVVDGVPAVLLVDEPEQRYLLMYIDYFMANAIRMGMGGPQLTRPLTHDLIGILLRRLGARVERVTITALKDNTYYALLSIQVNGETAQFDARPSDALAIAVRQDTPILIAAPLLKPVEQRPAPQAPAQPPPPEDEAAKGRT